MGLPNCWIEEDGDPEHGCWHPHRLQLQALLTANGAGIPEVYCPRDQQCATAEYVFLDCVSAHSQDCTDRKHGPNRYLQPLRPTLMPKHKLLVGIMLLGEPANAERMISDALVLARIVGLKVSPSCPYLHIDVFET